MIIYLLIIYLYIGLFIYILIYFLFYIYSFVLVKKYYDKQRIDPLIYDSVIKFGRDEKIANQWIAQLNRQEIFTIGDLRSLYEDDWYHLGLSVLAIRAIKDTLYYIN